MKKGISLIVLVITIIVMIILAAAIIISISNSNVINKASQAVSETDIANVKDAAALKYSDAKLGGISEPKTAEYIEDELIADNVIAEANPYVFTNQGGAFYIPEYDVTSNTKSDYRVLNNTLYYLGTDIDKRLALKDNSNINTDYILLYTDADTNKDRAYKLSDLTGYQTRVNSYKITKAEGWGENSENANTGGSDVTLSTGTTLYLEQNYASKLGTIIICGDINFEGKMSTTGSYWLYADGESIISQTVLEGMDSTAIMTLAADIDMDGKINGEKDGQLLFCITDEFEMGRLYTQNIRKWQ